MKPISVLIVDDNAIFLDIAADFVQAQDGLTVIGIAGGGEEALMLAEERRPAIILIDLHMPDISGLDIIPYLRKMLPQAGIIVLTLQSIDTYRELALAIGANDFISKPKMYTDLLPAIQSINQINHQGKPGNANQPV